MGTIGDGSETKIAVLRPDGDVESWSVVAAGDGTGRWHVRLRDGSGEAWEGEGEDLFEVFRVLRAGPERRGFRFLVAGARVDCWPTRMSGQMSGGAIVARHHKSTTLMVLQNLLGFVSRRFVYRHVFESAPASKVGTVAEQDAYMDWWSTRW